MPCVELNKLPIDSQLAVRDNVPITWQPPNGDLWGGVFKKTHNVIESGIARIISLGGDHHAVRFDSVCLCFLVPYTKRINYVQFKFKQSGGDLNLVINEEVKIFHHFKEISGVRIKGVSVKILDGDGITEGTIELIGPMRINMAANTRPAWGHMAIGGDNLLM